MKKLKVFAAHEGMSEYSTRLIARFTQQGDAIAATQNKGWYGGNGTVTEEVITIYDSFEEYAKVKKADARESALAKLTAEEKEALGLR